MSVAVHAYNVDPWVLERFADPAPSALDRCEAKQLLEKAAPLLGLTRRELWMLHEGWSLADIGRRRHPNSSTEARRYSLKLGTRLSRKRTAAADALSLDASPGRDPR